MMLAAKRASAAGNDPGYEEAITQRRSEGPALVGINLLAGLFGKKFAGLRTELGARHEQVRMQCESSSLHKITVA